MRKFVLLVTMMCFITFGVFANPFVGEWIHVVQGQGWESDGDIVTTIVATGTGWNMYDNQSPGGDNPPDRYTISGNTVTMRLNHNNSVFGTGTITGNSMRLRSPDGTERTFARNNISVPGESILEKLHWLNTNAASHLTYNIELTRNESVLNHTFYYSDRNNITIQLIAVRGERSIAVGGDVGRMFTVGRGVTLVLNSGVTLWGLETGTFDSRVVTLNTGGRMLMNEGSKIAGSSDGGVHVAGGIFSMTGGEISGNSARNGAGVDISEGGTFVMNGGTITSNRAEADGGGVAVREGAFWMHGGTIYGNRANANGGGVDVAGGVFTMTNGLIHTNAAARSGGGVGISGDGIFSKSGGTITGVDSPAASNTGNGVVVGGNRVRNNASGPRDNLDSRQAGTAGGWLAGTGPNIPDGHSAPRVVRQDFTTPGTHTFSFTENVPVTVEVYKLGAGGGGQGGHSKSYQQGLGTRTEHGTGATGGGGAATYFSFTTTGPFTINITVGAGGGGGARHSRGVGGSWESGNPGGNGGDTTVRIGSTTLVAQGGRGGGGSAAQAISGGAGGTATARPTSGLTFAAWTANAGGSGVNGRHNANLVADNRGGAAGRLTTGTETPFGGGLGALAAVQAAQGSGGRGGHGNEVGTAGGNGRVLIIVRQ